MWRRLAVALVLFSWTAVLAPTSSFAQEQPEIKRKIVNRVVPLYPGMARTMNLQGSVKVDALVAANGTIKSVQVKGGHPVLAQSAVNAIRKWKWEPAAHETSEAIEIRFDPR